MAENNPSETLPDSKTLLIFPSPFSLGNGNRNRPMSTLTSLRYKWSYETPQKMGDRVPTPVWWSFNVREDPYVSYTGPIPFFGSFRTRSKIHRLQELYYYINFYIFREGPHGQSTGRNWSRSKVSPALRKIQFANKVVTPWRVYYETLWRTLCSLNLLLIPTFFTLLFWEE